MFEYMQAEDGGGLRAGMNRWGRGGGNWWGKERRPNQADRIIISSSMHRHAFLLVDPPPPPSPHPHSPPHHTPHITPTPTPTTGEVRVFEGHAFIVEAAVSVGGRELKPGINVYRFANRIPLLFEGGSDVITRTATKRINWSLYKINQTSDKVGNRM